MEMTVIQPNYQSEVLKLFAKNQQKMIKRSNDSHAMVRFFRTSKVGYVCPMVVVLPGVESGPNEHLKSASRCIFRLIGNFGD